jgi:DegV family protein with EDD domain
VVPLSVTFGSDVLFDGELSHDEYWEKTRGPVWPKSSQPSVGAFEEVFSLSVGQGYRVLCLTITSHHSGTFNSAWLAAKKFGEKVVVVDSLSVSAGLGWQVVAAVEGISQGQELEDLVTMGQGMSRKTRLFALLDTIENVRKGGRVSKAVPVLGRLMRVLKVKPVLVMIDGEPTLLAPVRSYSTGLDRIREEVAALKPIEKMTVIHTRQPEQAPAFADVLAETTGFPRREILLPRPVRRFLATRAPG